MFAEALGDAERVGVAIDRRVVFALPLSQLRRMPVKETDAARAAFRRKVWALTQENPVADEPAQLLGKRLSFRGAVVFVDLLQFAQQMHEAILPVVDFDGVLRRPEVVNQSSRESFDEKSLQRR